jgi:hypothetical protein
MAEYHVGAGLFGIYAGTLNPKGDTWRNKSEVTREALSASAQYLLENEKEFRFQRKSDKKWFAMKVVDAEPPNAEQE